MFDRENGELRGRLKAASCLLRNGSSSSSSSVYTGIYDDQYVVYPDWAADRETRKLTLDDLIKYSSEISPDFIVLRDAWPRDNNNDDDEVTATARISLTEKRFRYLPEVSRRRDKVVYICVGVCVCVAGDGIEVAGALSRREIDRADASIYFFWRVEKRAANGKVIYRHMSRFRVHCIFLYYSIHSIYW